MSAVSVPLLSLLLLLASAAAGAKDGVFLGRLTNNPCAGCSTCVAVSEPSQGGVNDAVCAPCSDGQTWWPCDTSPQQCMCLNDGSSTSPAVSTSGQAASTTPAISTTARPELAECSKCAADTPCLFASNNQCYAMDSEAKCLQWSGNTWCGGTSASTTAASTSGAPPTTAYSSSSTSATVAPTTTTTSTVTSTFSTAGSTTSALPTVTTSALPLAEGDLGQLVDALKASEAEGVFMYTTPSGSKAPSDIYTWADMITATQMMGETGIGDVKFWTGEAYSNAKQPAYVYGLVNLAAFLAQCMQETIQYNACDENNWSDKAVRDAHGGSTYSSTSACGQLHQSYQDYQCSAEEDALAGGKMACDVDPNMETQATTQAQWYGAPPKLFCAPKTKLPKAPRWDVADPWCAPEGGWGHLAPFPDDVDMDTYLEYVNSSGSCKDYAGIQAGGWKYAGEGCVDGACPGSPAPLFGQPEGRTDLEGCCWWGRGVIQTTGVCNFGKLNYFMGKRAYEEGRQALFPNVDFCKDPAVICKPEGPPELKWIAGFFYWMNSVQPYTSGGWNYYDQLKAWVDNGMSMSESSFIDGASGIVNRGCHNPPACGTGELHAAPERRQNFKTVLRAMGFSV